MPEILITHDGIQRFVKGPEDLVEQAWTEEVQIAADNQDPITLRTLEHDPEPETTS